MADNTSQSTPRFQIAFAGRTQQNSYDTYAAGMGQIDSVLFSVLEGRQMAIKSLPVVNINTGGASTVLEYISGAFEIVSRTFGSVVTVTMDPAGLALIPNAILGIEFPSGATDAQSIAWNQYTNGAPIDADVVVLGFVADDCSIIWFNGNQLALDVSANLFENSSYIDSHKVLISGTDTTPEYLGTKVVAGANITVTKLGGGGDETLQIAATGLGGTTRIKTSRPLIASEVGVTFVSFEGGDDPVVLTLPGGVPGYIYRFTSDGTAYVSLHVLTVGGDVIIFPGLGSVAEIRSAEKGASIELLCTKTGEWTVADGTGGWYRWDGANQLYTNLDGAIGPIPGVGDHSVVLKDAGCSASGDYSVATGFQCQASGDESMATGSLCQATAIASRASGIYAKARWFGQDAKSSKPTGSVGDAQWSEACLHASTSDATLTPMSLDGMGTDMDLEAGKAYSIEFSAVAKLDSGAIAAAVSWDGECFLVVSAAGTVTLIGKNFNREAETVVTNESLWNIDVVAGAGSVGFWVTQGAQVGTVEWMCAVRVVERLANG